MLVTQIENGGKPATHKPKQTSNSKRVSQRPKETSNVQGSESSG